MRWIDDGATFRLAGYPFRKVNATPARRVIEVLPERYPPEVWLDDGEILFVARPQLEALVRFADRNRIPLTDREDVWSLLLEDCLDTEFSAEWKQRTQDTLRALSISPDEEKRWRDRVHRRMLWWNGFVWEWMHLGHYDLLSAFYGPLARLGLGKFPALYRDSMALAQRAPRRSWDETAFRKELEAGFETELFAHWQSVWSALQLPASREVFLEILAAYGPSGRYYHDVSHLRAVVQRLVEKNASPETQLAGWFHDFIDPSSKGAEEKSAVAAEARLLALFVPAEKIARVGALIRTTANHWALTGEDADARQLAEADLRILGENPLTYHRYVGDVRLEYRRVPWLLFRLGRMKFLKALLQHQATRGKLGFGDDPRWEERALQNVRDELAQWRGFRTPRWKA